MAAFVLIHGGFHGAWCWDKVIPLLEAQGHSVMAFDLPGHGADKTPLGEVTMEAYVERVCKALDAQPEPVILVGHSMGGGVVTQTAENRPGKIKVLVYLSGILPKNGQTLRGLFNSEENVGSLIHGNLIFSEDRLSSTLREDALRDIFYGDCSEEDVAQAKALWVPQALAPFFTPLQTTEANFGSVPKVYIETLADQCHIPAFQRMMYTAQPCKEILSLNTSHCPIFSAPEELVGHLTAPSVLD